MGRYVLKEDTEKSIERLFKFIQLAGILSMRKLSWQAYQMYTFTLGVVSTAHLLYSLYVFSGDVDRQAVTLHHSALFSVIFVAVVLCESQRDAFTFLFNGCILPFFPFIFILILENVVTKIGMHFHISDVCCSYDYGGEIMRKIQEQTIHQKNKTFSKIGIYMPICNVIMCTNLLIVSVAEKFILSKPHFELFPCWYPSFINQSNVVVNLIVFFTQLYSMAYSGFTIFSGLGVVYAINVHISSEYRLLKFALANLKGRTIELAKDCGFCDDEEQHKKAKILNEAYIKALKMCAEHHTIIIS